MHRFFSSMRTLAVAISLVAGCEAAQAAPTISFSAPLAEIHPGSSFSLSILATDFPVNLELLGGGLDITSSDPSVLRIDAATFDPSWEESFSDNPVIDDAGSHANRLGFGSFSGKTGSFLIGSISFTAVSDGISQIDLLENVFNGGFTFFDASNPNPAIPVISFAGSTLTVTPVPQAVPLPGAAWLFASAMAGFVGLRTRSAALA
ncbi:hypothetical protein [Methylomonas albis]|uniref:Cohesin domain-containing protein n=1 Tax=Methylomonas albis TaxID=1854563 RepID=A0ABR9D1N3_9GAMM|nr:hypothetical protein [Methylomonas albis]MBD9357035.1 hypothetical protein [Methylomonas albis]